MSDLSLISSFKIHSAEVKSVCELEDGSFVSGSEDGVVKMWDNNGIVLQFFCGHSGGIYKVIKINSDTIVSASSDLTAKIWKVSTGECLHTLSFDDPLPGFELETISEDAFVSAHQRATGPVVRAWNDKGDLISIVTQKPQNDITLISDVIVRLRDGSIVVANKYQLGIRKL